MAGHAPEVDYFEVVIVGGGFAGNAAAASILHQQLATKGSQSRKLRIRIIEKDAARLFGGVAYSLASAEHVTNTPAAVMSLIHTDTASLRRELEGDDTAFRQVMPRKAVAVHVKRMTTALASRAAKRGHIVEFLTDEVVSTDAIRHAAHGVVGAHVKTIRNQHYRADALVLSYGTTRSVAHPAVLNLLTTTPKDMQARIVVDYWRQQAQVEKIFADARERGVSRDADILVIGTGLTSLDAALTAQARGIFGDRFDKFATMTLVSRHGNFHPAADYTKSMPHISYDDILERWASQVSYVGQSTETVVSDFIERLYEEYNDKGFENWQITRVIAPHAARFVRAANIDMDVVWGLLREHSSLVATTSVGVGRDADKALDDLIDHEHVSIEAGSITGLEVITRGDHRFHSTFVSAEGGRRSQEHFAVISALGTDLNVQSQDNNRSVLSDLLRAGVVQPHRSERGLSVADQGHLEGSNGRIFGLGTLVAGSMTELYGRTGPLAMNAEAVTLLAEQIGRQVILLANGVRPSDLPKIQAPAFAVG